MTNDSPVALSTRWWAIVQLRGMRAARLALEQPGALIVRVCQPPSEDVSRLRRHPHCPLCGVGFALDDAERPCLEIDVLLAQRHQFFGPATLVQHEAPEVIESLEGAMLVFRAVLLCDREPGGARREVRPFLCLGEDMHSHKILVTGNIHMPDGVITAPTVLDRVLKEFGKRVQVVPKRYFHTLVS